ncbi:MAG: heavy metal-associated domain-containing protein [Methylotenera sp.]
MKVLLAILVSFLVSMPAFAVTSIKAEVNGMVCAFCAKGIEKKLKALPEGQGTYVDLKSRVVVLELKDGLDVSLEKFTKIIKDAGYSVRKVGKVEQSAAEIKEEVAKGAK